MASRAGRAARKGKKQRAGKAKRKGNRRKLSSYFKRPHTARQYFRLAPKDQETWNSTGHVITRMRDGVSLPKASKEFDIAPSLVIELGRPALRKKNGRYLATKTDRLLRVFNILKSGGKREIATRDSRQASLVGAHWAAVQRFLQTGDDVALQRFKNSKVTDASGKRHSLLTDLKELDRLGRAGVLSFESMYAGGSR
jgi:hypothetical protein